MSTTIWNAAMPAVLLTAALGALAAPEERGDGAGRMVRAGQEQPQGGQRPASQGERWEERLSDPDLDRREGSYRELIEAARRDGALEALTETWARGEGELAWTARLALREVRQLSIEKAGDRGRARGLSGREPFAGPWLDGRSFSGLGMPDLERLFEDMRAMQRQLAEQAGALPPPGGARSDARERMESFQLEAGPDGAKATVRRRVDGEVETKEYEAGSLEELFRLHPELSGDMQPDVRIEVPKWRFDFGVRPPLPFSGLGGLEGEPLRTDILGVVVRPLAPAEAARYHLDGGAGLLVERVEPGTIAAALGVRRGNVLLELNGRRLAGRDDISAELEARGEDGEVSLVIVDAWGQRRTRVWRPAQRI